MDLQEFLGRILPATGTYYTVQITSTGITRQFKHTTIAEAKSAIEAITNRHHNAYIATGAFGNQRTKKECKLKRDWYVDIDCKEGGQYPDKAAARAAISAALKSGLPPFSIMIDSGNGYHLHWTITDDVTQAQWAPYAKAINMACSKHGLNVDSVVTEDVARILRAPNTLNYKDPQHPKPCRVVLEARQYDFESLSASLNPYLTGPAAVPASTVDNSDLSDGLNEGKKASAAEMVEACPLFRDTRDTHGANQSEPLWHKIVHTLVYCEDGHDFIHALSDGHDSYTPERTERKWRARLEYKEQSGPITCDTFSTLSSICKSCEYRGKIKSPIKLGFGKPPELPWPYRNDNNVLEKYDGEEWQQAIRYTIRNLEAAQVRGEETYIKLDIGNEHINTELSNFIDNRSLQTMLVKYTVTLDTYELEELRRLMNAWLKQLRDTRQLSKVVRQYGWTETHGFHFAGTVYQPDGSTTPAFVTDQNLADVFTPKGELTPWTQCADHILSHPREAAWCIVASAFAAPLIEFTGATGALLSVVSQESGSGKSTAMKVAQSVWGHPKKGMASLNDTANSVSHSMGILNNLPAYWDEVRERAEVLKFIHVVFRLGQGREKQRLTSNIQQRKAGDWSTLMTIASNEPLVDHIVKQIGNSDAGAARVFEVRAHSIQKDSMNDATARHFYSELNRNYGNAGAVYAAYLAVNHKQIAAEVRAYDAKMASLFNTTGDERFWVATIATLVIGAKIATTLGLCTFNLPALQGYLIKEFKRLRASKSENFELGTSRAVTLLGRFLHEKVEHILRSDTLPRRGRVQSTILMANTRHPVLARVAFADKTIRILKEDFESWVYERDGAGFSHVVDDLLALGAKKHRGSIDAGAAISSGARQQVIDVPYNTTAFSGLAPLVDATTDNSDLG